MVPAEHWPERDTENAHHRQIDAICDALRVGPDDDFRRGWRDYAGRLPGQAHRRGLAAPRPVGPTFRALWEDGQTVILKLSRRIEANFTATLPLIHRLASGPPDVKTLRSQVPHSTVALDRFFEQVSVAWLEPLRGAGYFDRPPSLAPNDDGSVGYQRWPQGRYLARVAADAPDVVIEVCLALDTDNPEANESMVDAALAMEAGLAARMAPAVARALSTPVQWALPFKARDLVVHLVLGDAVAEGLVVLSALLSSATGRNDRNMAGHLVGELTHVIFPRASLDGLDLLSTRLAEELTAESHGTDDYSYIWRPTLEGARRQDLRDQLVSSVRDAATAIVIDDGAHVGRVVETLEAHEWSIFRRIALDVLSTSPDPALVEARLTQRALFESVGLEREYTTLSREQFSDLTQAARQRVFGWVEEGPPWLAEADDDARERWQLRMLDRLGRLPERWQARLNELRARYGEPEAAPIDTQVWRGPQAPVSDAELSDMTVDELVAFVSEWQPTADHWQGPSPEGLGRAVRRVVAADPARFASEAGAFTDWDPTYVRALVGGLREARRNGLTFAWHDVLDLCRATLDKPRDIEGRHPSLLDDVDPGWSWTWQEALHLVREGLQGDQGRIPDEERDAVWSLIWRLSEDPQPVGGEGTASDGMGAATAALNSIRGAAMHAAFQYMWWLRDERREDQRRLPTELAELLERHLDPAVEPSDAIRSVYGQWFPYLVASAPEFAASHVTAIFPADPASAPLWRAAWDAYVRFNRLWPSAFELLAEQYQRAIGELGPSSSQDELLGDAGEALVGHLMSLYWQGIISFGDEHGLLDAFYTRASVERRAQAIEAIGHGLFDGDAPSEEGAMRLRALWERRVEAVRASNQSDAGKELNGYAWWFASGHFTPDWSLAQLKAMVEAGGRIEADHLVAERLANLRSSQRLEVVRVLERLIETGTREWFVSSAREEITVILTDALAAGGQTEAHARDLTNRLIARGHRDFGAILRL
jgi:hypothetical protein